MKWATSETHDVTLEVTWIGAVHELLTDLLLG